MFQQGPFVVLLGQQLCLHLPSHPTATLAFQILVGLSAKPPLNNIPIGPLKGERVCLMDI